MEKFKFEKPFASFKLTNKPLKEQWRIALHDPAYLTLVGIIIGIFIFGVISLFS